jgi:hypothetical protein
MKNYIISQKVKLFHFLFLFFSLLEYVVSHKGCGIDLLKKPNRVLVKQENENKRMLTQGDWEPIRIHLDFSYIENNLDRMKKQDYIDLKEKIMPKTAQVFEKILKVKRIQHKLKLNAPSCETFPIPEKYNSEGVDADLVIFVLLDDTKFFEQNRVEAAAIHCLQHFETRRPIAGYIQFKQDLNVHNSTALDYMVWLAVHEVSHILVMNNGLYDDYIDPVTLQPHGFDRIIGSKTHPTAKKMNFIRSKGVLEKARAHFGCPSLDGVPLEYNGGSGTAGAHWSKRYMNTDYMIGDSYGENLMSDITLALFEDSGWYQVNFEMSNLFLWGKNKGCDFFDLNKKCIDFNENTNEITTLFKNEFCTKLNYPVCSIGNVFRGSCYAKAYDKDLNPYERYFSNPKIGGSDPLTDRCPISFEEKQGLTYYGGSCKVGYKPENSFEKVCPECGCFMSNLRPKDSQASRKLEEKKKLRFKQILLKSEENEKEDKNKMKEPSRQTVNNKLKDSVNTSTENNNKNKLKNPAEKRTNQVVEKYFKADPELTSEDLSAGCFEFSCIDGLLYLMIDSNSYMCPSNNSITVEGYNGSIFCPDNQSLCHKKYKCKFGCTE